MHAIFGYFLRMKKADEFFHRRFTVEEHRRLFDFGQSQVLVARNRCNDDINGVAALNRGSEFSGLVVQKDFYLYLT